MPVSDAVARLLATKSGKHTPAPEPEPSTDPDADENVDAAERERREGFRERARREDERFRLATDSEFWLALCFRRPGDPPKFCTAVGIDPDGRYLPGPALAKALGERPARTPRDRARALLAARTLKGDDDAAGRLNTGTHPDPLADVRYTGDLAADTEAELVALLTALTAPPDQAPANVLDSPHWLAVYFPSREAKEQFLADTGLDVLGDKYLDGHQAASILKVRL